MPTSSHANNTVHAGNVIVPTQRNRRKQTDQHVFDLVLFVIL